MTRLEHINFTVPDPRATAAVLEAIFGWHVRWEGPSKDQGRSVHVGEAQTGGTYLALYAPRALKDTPAERYTRAGALNHIGVVVDDLDAIEERVRAAGHEPHSHDDYEPGRRFYFDGPDGVEYEVASYG